VLLLQDLQWNCPLRDPTGDWLYAYFLGIAIELLKSPVKFILARGGAYTRTKKKLKRLQEMQDAAGTKVEPVYVHSRTRLSMLDPLNIVLEARGFHPFGVATKAVGLQFLAVARRRGKPFHLCPGGSTYGSTVVDGRDVTEEAAVAEYVAFHSSLNAVDQSKQVTMKHVCAWCGWQLKGHSPPALKTADLRLTFRAAAGTVAGAAVGIVAGVGIGELEGSVQESAFNSFAKVLL
jgi:hypothetical protein